MTNLTKVALVDGREVALSYGVPVAAFVPGLGYVKTATKYSVTSSRHATVYAGDRAKVLDAEAFAAVIHPIDPKGGR